jgi:CDP-6-deoxy-D-xylo-4-hexulose-3-dehydrase
MGKQPFWIKKFGHKPLKVADVVHDYGLYLPNHLYIDEEKIKFITDKFKEVAIPKFIV